MTHQSFTRAGAVAAALLITAACASQQTTQTGFLNEAAIAAQPLRIDPNAPDRLAVAASADQVARYHSVLIEDVAFRPGPKIPDRIDPAVLADLRTSYRAALAEAFGQRFQIVATSGPGVLRVRAAITGYERANVALNVAMLALVGPVTAGGAASESEALDSVTGERIAALATHDNGTPLMGGPVGYYTQHGHARRALARHATELAALLPTQTAK